MEKVMISLSGRNQSWFDKKTTKEKKEYLKAHPKSKFGPHSKSTTSTKKKAAPAKPVAKKAAPAKKGAKKVIVKMAPKAAAKPAAKAKRPNDKKPVAKTAAKKDTSVKKKAAPRKKKEVVVHKDTAQIHEHAMKQKKAQIDKVIAPYARELGKLRTKRDAGGGLSTDESNRYKQLLETITKLHKGRND